MRTSIREAALASLVLSCGSLVTLCPAMAQPAVPQPLTQRATVPQPLTPPLAQRPAVPQPATQSPTPQADLVWEVESPFRLFKRPAHFEMQERAYRAVRGAPTSAIPGNIVWRTERRLNDPDCADPSTPTACAATRRANYDTSRLGWAAQVVDNTCYERNAPPRRYSAQCERQYSWGSVREDYIRPDAHTVRISLSPPRLAQAGAGDCLWSWQPRKAGLRVETRKQACKAPLVIPRLPWSADKSQSGASVTVTLPSGEVLRDPDVTVEDLLVVAMGDSFASGESNPDRPVTFSPSRQMVYDPTLLREEVADAGRSLKKGKAMQNFGLASFGTGVDPKMLPRRLLDDERKSQQFRLSSADFNTAFERSNARWFSPDCHRSLYGYPFRVGLQLALENRKRSVTLVSLACTGSEVTDGVFMDRNAREGFRQPGGDKVTAQLDQLADLICEPGTRTQSQSYTLPMFRSGSTQMSQETLTKRWCAPQARKRPIDVFLLSIGGNDVGFSALAMYSLTESGADLAPIAGLIGHEIRFPPNVSRVYLESLDERMAALKRALNDGFGVPPQRVLQNTYEPLQFDETGNLCGVNPTLGVDVHPKLRYNRDRLKEVSDFHATLLARIECITSTSRRKDCPAGLATGSGTGFRLVTEHVNDFSRRGICARDPQRASVEGAMMGMPRRIGDDFAPYSPASALPYGKRWRLIHTPNDAFLTANTHREDISPFDILQPAYAALYSGAFHPTAEGHAIVADAVVKQVRQMLQETKH